MSKKRIWTASLIAFVLVFAIAGTALAASGDGAPDNHPPGPGRGDGPGRGGRFPHGRGEVMSISDDEFTVMVKDDLEITVLVDADTRYFGDFESFNDIEIGMTVVALGARQGDQTVLAKAIGAGDKFPLGQRTRGEVTDVDSDSLTIENRDGESLTFQVDGETLFFSRDDAVEGLSDVEVGDRVGVHYEEADDGTLIAKSIGVAAPKQDGSGNS